MRAGRAQQPHRRRTLTQILVEVVEVVEEVVEVEVRARASRDLRPFMLSVWVSGTDCGAGSAGSGRACVSQV